jgi:hypothetical protein
MTGKQWETVLETWLKALPVAWDLSGEPLSVVCGDGGVVRVVWGLNAT